MESGSKNRPASPTPEEFRKRAMAAAMEVAQMVTERSAKGLTHDGNQGQQCSTWDMEMPTPEELAEMEADSNWMAGLHHSMNGKKLCDYLAHLQSVLDEGSLGLECPIDQAVSFRSVLLHALEKKPTPFGLPKKLPGFIAMVNLCGEKMLLTTQRSNLFQLMAHAPGSPRQNSDAAAGMMQMIKFRDENPEYTLLLTYSAPFQVNLETLWWDVRTIHRDETTGKITDGHLTYQVGESKPRETGCTSNFLSSSLYPTLESEVAAYEANFAAVDLDVEIGDVAREAEGGGPSTGSASPAIAKLKQLCAGLQTQLKNEREANEHEIESIKYRHSVDMRQEQEKAKMSGAAERDNDEAQQREIERLTKETRGALDTLDKEKKKHAELMDYKLSELNKEQLLKDQSRDQKMKDQANEIKQLKAQLAVEKASSASASKRLNECNKARERQLKKRDDDHLASLGEMERRVQQATMAQRSAEQETGGMLEKLTSLSHAMEGRDAEKELLQHHLKDEKLRTRMMRVLVALAAVRGDSMRGRLVTLDLASGAAGVETTKLQELVGERETERDSLGEANAKLQKRIQALEERVEGPSAATTPKPVMVDSGFNAEYDPRSAQIDELSAEIANLNGRLESELEAKSREIVDLQLQLRNKTKGKKSAAAIASAAAAEEQTPSSGPVLGVPSQSGGGHGGQQPYIINQVHVGNGNNGNMASTDLGYDPNIESSVEALIAQAAHSLRSLADMARESHRHKAAANDFCAQVRALQGYGGYHAPHMQMQGMQPMQPMQMMPMSPGTHSGHGYAMQ